MVVEFWRARVGGPWVTLAAVQTSKGVPGTERGPASLCGKQSYVPWTVDAQHLPEVLCASDDVGNPGGRPWHVGLVAHDPGYGGISRGPYPGLAGMYFL